MHLWLPTRSLFPSGDTFSTHAITHVYSLYVRGYAGGDEESEMETFYLLATFIRV